MGILILFVHVESGLRMYNVDREIAGMKMKIYVKE